MSKKTQNKVAAQQQEVPPAELHRANQEKLDQCSRAMSTLIREIESLACDLSSVPATMAGEQVQIPPAQKAVFELWMNEGSRGAIEAALKAAGQEETIHRFAAAYETAVMVKDSEYVRDIFADWLLDVIDILERIRGQVKPKKVRRHSVARTTTGARYVIETAGCRFESGNPAWAVTNAQRGLKARGIVMDRESLRALVQEVSPAAQTGEESTESVSESSTESTESA